MTDAQIVKQVADALAPKRFTIGPFTRDPRTPMLIAEVTCVPARFGTLCRLDPRLLRGIHRRIALREALRFIAEMHAVCPTNEELEELDAEVAASLREYKDLHT